MIKTLLSLFRNLSQKNKSQLLFVQILMILSSVLEILSILLIVPFISIIGSYSNFENNFFIKKMYFFFEHNNKEDLIFYLSLIILIFYFDVSQISRIVALRLQCACPRCLEIGRKFRPIKCTREMKEKVKHAAPKL